VPSCLLSLPSADSVPLLQHCDCNGGKNSHVSEKYSPDSISLKLTSLESLLFSRVSTEINLVLTLLAAPQAWVVARRRLILAIVVWTRKQRDGSRQHCDCSAQNYSRQLEWRRIRPRRWLQLRSKAIC
jgi:hypothetical protein